ncbi:MAG: hypothetical protein ACLRWP_06915 [Bilophila wadsworthia]
MEKTAQATLSAPITVQGKRPTSSPCAGPRLATTRTRWTWPSPSTGEQPVTVELCTLSIVTGFPTTCSGRSTRTTSGRSARRTIPSALRSRKEGGGRNRDGYDARGRLHGLRLAMLSLAKFSGWSRTEIRNLTPEAFVGYADAAKDMDDNGA